MNMSNMRFYVWGAILLSLAAILAMLITGTRPAKADGYNCWDIDGCPRHYRHVRHHRPHSVVVRYYNPPEWTREDRDEDKRPVCVADYVKVVSTEHTTKDRAMENAKRMWSAAAQWDWGSKYMAVEQASDYREWCGQSNAMDTASGRVNETVSHAVGKEGVNVRCIIRARPCRARLEEAEGHRSADWDAGMKR